MYQIINEYVNTGDKVWSLKTFENIAFSKGVFIDDIDENTFFKNCIFMERVSTSLSVVNGILAFENCIFIEDTCLETITHQSIELRKNIFKKGLFITDSDIKGKLVIEGNVIHGFTDINLFGKVGAGSGSVKGTITILDNIFIRKDKALLYMNKFMCH